MFKKLFLLFCLSYASGVGNNQFLHSCFYTILLFQDIGAPVFDIFFSLITYKLKRLVSKFISPFVSEVLHILTVGHLLLVSVRVRFFVVELFNLCLLFSLAQSFKFPVMFFLVFDILNNYLSRGLECSSLRYSLYLC